MPVVCVGIRGEASPELVPLVQRFYWTRPTQMGRMIRCFKREGVEQIVMAGKVHKANLLHRPWKLLSAAAGLANGVAGGISASGATTATIRCCWRSSTSSPAMACGLKPP